MFYIFCSINTSLGFCSVSLLLSWVRNEHYYFSSLKKKKCNCKQGQRIKNTNGITVDLSLKIKFSVYKLEKDMTLVYDTLTSYKSKMPVPVGSQYSIRSLVPSK